MYPHSDIRHGVRRKFGMRGHCAMPSDKDVLFTEYLPLVRALAERMIVRLPDSVTLDELVNAGTIGLWDAIKKYDVSKETSFKTYAEFRIKGAMLDELRSRDWMSRGMRRKNNEVLSVQEALERRLGRPPEHEEVAEALGMDLADYFQLAQELNGAHVMELDARYEYFGDGSEENPLEMLADENAQSPADAMESVETKRILEEAIAALPDKERLVLSLYYEEGLTLKEIGEVMGYTESRISQIRSKALSGLRALLAEKRCDLV